MTTSSSRTAPHLPADRRAILMGRACPTTWSRRSARGIDMFDCVLPTRNARNGQLFTRRGRFNIRNARYADDDRPPTTSARCYLPHFRAPIYGTWRRPVRCSARPSNRCTTSSFTLTSWRAIREAIEFGSFEEFRQKFHRTFSRSPLTR